MNYYLTHGATTSLCCWEMRRDWFDAALSVLKTQGSDAWAVALKGA